MKETTLELYAEHLLAFTHEKYDDFRQEDMNKMSSGPTSPLPGPTTPMTIFTGHTKGSTASESQIALNSFKKVQKGMHQHFPSSRMIFIMILSKDLSWQSSKHKDYDVADPDFDPDDGDQYDKQLFKEKQSPVYSVLDTSLQTDMGRKLVKEFEGDARTIISKLHHYHTE